MHNDDQQKDRQYGDEFPPDCQHKYERAAECQKGDKKVFGAVVGEFRYFE